jgi:hypothetical protein
LTCSTGLAVIVKVNDSKEEEGMGRFEEFNMFGPMFALASHAHCLDVTGQGLEFRVRYFVLSLVMDFEIWPRSFDL